MPLYVLRDLVEIPDDSRYLALYEMSSSVQLSLNWRDNDALSAFIHSAPLRTAKHDLRTRDLLQWGLHESFSFLLLSARSPLLRSWLCHIVAKVPH